MVSNNTKTSDVNTEESNDNGLNLSDAPWETKITNNGVIVSLVSSPIISEIDSDNFQEVNRILEDIGADRDPDGSNNINVSSEELTREEIKTLSNVIPPGLPVPSIAHTLGINEEIAVEIMAENTSDQITATDYPPTPTTRE